MRSLAWLPLAIALLAAAPVSIAAAEPVREQGQSTIELQMEGDGTVAHSVNRRFDVVTLYPPGATRARTLMLDEEEEVVRSTVEEGPRSATVRLAGWEFGKSGTPFLSFRIEGQGESGAIADFGAGMPFYQITRYGCCGARDSISTWSLVNGRKLFSATGPAAFFDVPNSGGLLRLAAVHAAYSIDDDETFAGRRDVAGLITYATPTEQLRRVLVVVRAPATVDEMMGDPRAMLLVDGTQEPVRSTTLWPADGKRDPAAIGGLAIHVVFTPGNEVTIPIVGDDLDLANARVSPTLQLESIALEPVPSACSCRPPRRLIPEKEETTN
jgi:hypothetical protein